MINKREESKEERVRAFRLGKRAIAITRCVSTTYENGSIVVEVVAHVKEWNCNDVSDSGHLEGVSANYIPMRICALLNP